MSVGKRICEAIDRLAATDYEGALIPTSIAVDATASQVYPAKKNNEAYKDWLHDNMWLITKVGMGNVSIHNFRFRYNHPEVRCDPNGLCSLEQILYHVVRCGLLHAAKLPGNLRFGPPGQTKMEKDGTLVLSAGLICGMISAVVASSVNQNEVAPEHYGTTIFGRTMPLNQLWGKPDVLLGLFPTT
jgi:hypothetical protein